MRRCSFGSAREAVDALLDSKPLRELACAHGADASLITTPEGLLAETQRLWVPKTNPDTVAKIRSLPLAQLDAEIPDHLRGMSWELLDKLGFTSTFDDIPSGTKFEAVLAHGTKPPFAVDNFQRLIGLGSSGVDLGSEILFLSSASLVDKEQRVEALYPDYIWQSMPPETELWSMLWLWEYLRKPAPLREMKKVPVCAPHTPNKDPSKPARSPNTEQALRAMPKRCFGESVLVVSGRIEQTLRQDEITRAVLRDLGMTCPVHTIGVRGQTTQFLTVVLREVAATLWERMRRK